jgi:hypothetical protein
VCNGVAERDDVLGDRPCLDAPRDVAIGPHQHGAVGTEPEPLAETAVPAVQLGPDKERVEGEGNVRRDR